MLIKGPFRPSDKNNAVYKIPCLDCNVIVCVGETSKCVKDRIKEHKTAVNRKYEQSIIYQHTRQTEHHFDFDNTNFKVLQQQKSTGPRRILESIYSNLNPTAVNRCYQLPQQYNVIMKIGRRIIASAKFILWKF